MPKAFPLEFRRDVPGPLLAPVDSRPLRVRFGDTRSHGRGPWVGVLEALVGPREVVVLEGSATAAARFSIFFEKPLLKRVKRRIPIRMVRFARSTWLGGADGCCHDPPHVGILSGRGPRRDGRRGSACSTIFGNASLHRCVRIPTCAGFASSWASGSSRAWAS
jgi:hypothetical protein